MHAARGILGFRDDSASHCCVDLVRVRVLEVRDATTCREFMSSYISTAINTVLNSAQASVSLYILLAPCMCLVCVMYECQ
jgi:hypothetical protein